MSASILEPNVVHIWNEVCKRALHLAAQKNSGIPILKQQITQEIQSYHLKSEEEKKLLFMSPIFR